MEYDITNNVHVTIPDDWSPEDDSIITGLVEKFKNIFASIGDNIIVLQFVIPQGFNIAKYEGWLTQVLYDARACVNEHSGDVLILGAEFVIASSVENQIHYITLPKEPPNTNEQVDIFTNDVRDALNTCMNLSIEPELHILLP